jgi:hypothetical protein
MFKYFLPKGNGSGFFTAKSEMIFYRKGTKAQSFFYCKTRNIFFYGINYFLRQRRKDANIFSWASMIFYRKGSKFFLLQKQKYLFLGH